MSPPCLYNAKRGIIPLELLTKGFQWNLTIISDNNAIKKPMEIQLY